MKVKIANFNGNYVGQAKNPKFKSTRKNRIIPAQQPTFGGSLDYLPKLRGYAFAGLFGFASLAPVHNVSQELNKKINPNEVIYKIEDEDLELEPKLINPQDAKYKKHVEKFDSIYDRQEFSKKWNALPNSSKNIYENVENQVATIYLRDGKIPLADSTGVEEIRKSLTDVPNRNKNSIVQSVLESSNNALKNSSPDDVEKEIFNTKSLSPRKYKLFTDINYIIKDHFIFGKNNRLVRSDMPYCAENVKKVEKELKATYKEANFIDYIYKGSYKRLVNKLLRR